jgi:lysophospholipase L1-like esterase
VAFLGIDYCSEVSSNAHTWPHLVTQALQTQWPDVEFDYVNASGHGIGDALRNLEYRVSNLDPDVIVIYEANNDLTYNTFQLAVEQHIASKRADQELMWPSRYSLLWHLIEMNLRAWMLQRSATQMEGKLKLDKQRIVAPFRRDLVELVQASQRVAGLVVLLTFSTQHRKNQTPEQQARAAVTSLYYMPYMSISGLIDAFDSYNETIREVAQQRGALLVAGEDAIPGDAEHFVDSVHFTDKGSRAMADRILPVLFSSNVLGDIVSAKSPHLWEPKR